MGVNIRCDDEWVKLFRTEAKKLGITQAEAFRRAVKAWLLRKKIASLPLKKDPAFKLLKKGLDFGMKTDAKKIDDLIYGD